MAANSILAWVSIFLCIFFIGHMIWRDHKIHFERRNKIERIKQAEEKFINALYQLDDTADPKYHLSKFTSVKEIEKATKRIEAALNI